MRSPEEIFQELEEDRAQRESEIRLIENQLAKTKNEDEAKMLRRSLVLLAYAHLEGFCRFALLAYASAVNSTNLSCAEVSPPLVATSMRPLFASLADINSKHPEFARGLPNDRELHLTHRHQTFFEKLTDLLSQVVNIPDRAIDMSSNMSAAVLKRNLYALGLRYPAVDEYSNIIGRLLGVRNAIAHGDRLKCPKADEVKEYTTSAFKIMQFVQTETFQSLKSEAYRRAEVA